MKETLHKQLANECFCLDMTFKQLKGETKRIDKCLFIVVKRGRATLTVEEKEFVVDDSYVLLLHPNFSFKILQASDDFSILLMGFPIVMSHERTQRIKPNFFMFLYTKIAWRIDPYNREPLKHFCHLFRFAVSRYNGRCGRELVVSLVTSLVYGIYSVSDYVESDNISVDSSRSLELFRNFMDLLHENFTKEHEVQFYAGKLCISAKYLTQITKRMIGRTPKQIIDGRLIQEATKLLDMNNSSIQEISNKLGFSDQSYFGRFFKRMKRISPQQYRFG